MRCPGADMGFSGAEALYSGVPLVCCPIVAEQPNNSQQLAHLGAGVHVELRLPVQPQQLALDLGAALHKVLSSPTYQERARHLGGLMRAQRWSPAEKAAGAPMVLCDVPAMHVHRGACACGLPSGRSPAA